MADNLPYNDWSSDPHSRRIDAADTFGRHLAEGARDYALQRIHKSVSEETRAIATQAVLDALYGVMMVLEGITPNDVDAHHRIQYVLSARVRKRQEGTVETIELSPEGDGLCMGFHRWLNQEFE
jgi:hypothetical protein